MPNFKSESPYDFHALKCNLRSMATDLFPYSPLRTSHSPVYQAIPNDISPDRSYCYFT